MAEEKKLSENMFGKSTERGVERKEAEKEAKEAVFEQKSEISQTEEFQIKEKIEEQLANIEKMEVPSDIKKEVERDAEKMKELQIEGKLQRLLSLVSEKGLSYAVSVVKSTNDAYLLDSFHDALIKNKESEK